MPTLGAAGPPDAWENSDFKTTQGYIDLAGEAFREEAAVVERRLFGTELGTHLSAPEPLSAGTVGAVTSAAEVRERASLP